MRFFTIQLALAVILCLQAQSQFDDGTPAERVPVNKMTINKGKEGEAEVTETQVVGWLEAFNYVLRLDKQLVGAVKQAEEQGISHDKVFSVVRFPTGFPEDLMSLESHLKVKEIELRYGLTFYDQIDLATFDKFILWKRPISFLSERGADSVIGLGWKNDTVVSFFCLMKEKALE